MLKTISMLLANDDDEDEDNVLDCTLMKKIGFKFNMNRFCRSCR